MNRFLLYCISVLYVSYACAMPEQIAHNLVWDEASKQGVLQIQVELEPDNALYKEYTHFFADHEAVTLGEPETDVQAVIAYDPIFKENKSMYTQSVAFQIPVCAARDVNEAHIRFTYYTKSSGRIQEKTIPITLCTVDERSVALATAVETDVEVAAEQNQNVALQDDAADKDESWYCSVSEVIERTDALWLQLILVFLLGLLLSLTPCIYPMLPITIGILHGQGATTFARNLLMSLCYTAGIAMTFASMGLFAAYTGTLFGTALQHPAFTGVMVLFLGYFAGSMVGLYAMYVPSFLQPSGGSIARSSSPLAAFLFGAVSGTIASPCVSPGLALVLSMVAKLANPLYGFLLLFVFGVGLSMPLLVLGTFSGLLHALPKGGMWMVEIKRFFGFMMFGMCVYLLSSVLPAWMTAGVATVLLLSAGIYYLYAGKWARSLFMSFILYLLGCVCIIAATITVYMGVRAFYQTTDVCSADNEWLTDYTCAYNQAMQTHKKLLIKVEAPCCSLCRVVNRKFFTQADILQLMREQYVALRIDGSDTHNPDIKMLVERYTVVGFPTVLIVDAQDLRLVKKWSGDVHKLSVQEFKQLLTEYAKEKQADN